MTNEERFQQAVDRIQHERAAVLAQLESLTQSQLDFKPAARAWSIGEVGHHVSLAEKMVQDNLKMLLREGAGGRTVHRSLSYQELPLALRIIPKPLLEFTPFQLSLSMMTAFVPQAVQSYLLANPILKAEAAPILKPKPGLPLAELLQLLRDARTATLQQLESVKSSDLTRIRWSHPLIGKHDAYGMLELLADHDRRHLCQIEDVKNNRNFPGRG